MIFQAAISHDARVSDDKERTHKVKHSTLPSVSHSLICPICEAGELFSGRHHNGVQCPVCGYAREARPRQQPRPGTKYKAVVTTGARDLAGNRLDQSPGVAGSQPKVWVFTTKS
jgi:hypothetical protein